MVMSRLYAEVGWSITPDSRVVSHQLNKITAIFGLLCGFVTYKHIDNKLKGKYTVKSYQSMRIVKSEHADLGELYLTFISSSWIGDAGVSYKPPGSNRQDTVYSDKAEPGYRRNFQRLYKSQAFRTAMSRDHETGEKTIRERNEIKTTDALEAGCKALQAKSAAETEPLIKKHKNFAKAKAAREQLSTLKRLAEEFRLDRSGSVGFGRRRSPETDSIGLTHDEGSGDDLPLGMWE